MRKTLAGKRLKNLLLRKKTQHTGNFLNWHEAKHLVFILEKEADFSRHEFDQFLTQLDKHAEVLYIEPGSKSPSFSDWTCYTKKDVNLLALPKKHILQNLHQHKCDLVINTVRVNEVYSAALAGSINSTCVCSASDHLTHGDLHIKRREDQPLIDYIRQVIHYLKMIRPN